jgi:hypothetical protein
MPEQDDEESLVQSMETIPLKGAEADALTRRLLKGMAEGAGDTHRLAARALFGTAGLSEGKEKTYLLDQLYFCLTRALEDYAMLCLMNWDESRHPIDVYLNMDRPELRAFYSRARKNLLTEEQLFRVTGVCAASGLKRNPAFKMDLYDYETALEWASGDAKDKLSRFGRLYHSGLEDADPMLGPWQIAYAKAPIGLKLLLGSEEEPDRMLMGTEEIPDPHEPGRKITGAFSVGVQLDDHFAERLMHQLDEVCEELRRRAALKLTMMDDPKNMLQTVRREYLQHLQAAGQAKREAQALAQGLPAPEAEPAGGRRLRVVHSYIVPAKKLAEQAEASKAAASTGTGAAKGRPEPVEGAAPAPESRPVAPKTLKNLEGLDSEEINPASGSSDASASHEPGEVKKLGGIKIIHSKGFKE